MIGKKMRRMPFAIIRNTWLQFPKISVMPLDEWNPVEDRITLYQQAWNVCQKNKGGRFL